MRRLTAWLTGTSFAFEVAALRVALGTAKQSREAKLVRALIALAQDERAMSWLRDVNAAARKAGEAMRRLDRPA